MSSQDYLQQAKTFFDKTSTTFKCKYLYTGKYFHDDKEVRDVYEITIRRGTRSYTTKFGQSVHHTGKYVVKDRGLHKFYDRNDAVKFCKSHSINPSNSIKNNPHFEIPDEYSFLACVQKSEPGSFDEFCSDMGYNDLPLSEYNRIKAIYDAVAYEYSSLRAMYFDNEIAEMADIQ